MLHGRPGRVIKAAVRQTQNFKWASYTLQMAPGAQSTAVPRPAAVAALQPAMQQQQHKWAQGKLQAPRCRSTVRRCWTEHPSPVAFEHCRC